VAVRSEVVDQRAYLLVVEFGGVQLEERAAALAGEPPASAFEHRDVCLHQVVDGALDASLFVSGGGPEETPRERGDVRDVELVLGVAHISLTHFAIR